MNPLARAVITAYFVVAVTWTAFVVALTVTLILTI